MRRRAVALAALAILATLPGAGGAHAADAPRRLAFERAGAVWVASLDGSGAKRVAAGADPAISPDGGRLAYTTDEPSATTPVRHVAVADLASGKSTVFRDVPSDNAFGPAWSPDGKRLAFAIFVGGAWQLALIDASGRGFAVVKHTGPTCNGAVWAPDGRTLFCQDMDAILRLAPDGTVEGRFELKKIVADGDMNSGSELAIAPDGKTLLMDVDQAEEHDRKDWDGPQPAIWSYALGAAKAVRISPKALFAWEPRWLGDSELLFVVQGAGEKEPSIYRAPVADLGKRKLLVKGAREPSVSR